MSEEERARFCDSCNAVIGWYATFCDACGMRIGDGGRSLDEPAKSSENREVASVEQDLYRSHLRLIHKSLEDGEKIKREALRLVRSLKDIEAHPRRGENPRKLIAHAERVVELEEDWEELQHRYNRQSEGIEEEFLGKIDELEADLELSPHHQEAIEEEVAKFMRTIEECAEEIRETGRFLDVVRARQGSGALGFGGGNSATLIAGALAAAMAVAGALWGLLGEAADPVLIGKIAGPAWIGMIVLIVHARTRGR